MRGVCACARGEWERCCGARGVLGACGAMMLACWERWKRWEAVGELLQQLRYWKMHLLARMQMLVVVGGQIEFGGRDCGRGLRKPRPGPVITAGAGGGEGGRGWGSRRAQGRPPSMAAVEDYSHLCHMDIYCNHKDNSAQATALYNN